MITIKGIKFRVGPLLEESKEAGMFLLGQIQIHKALIGIRLHDTDEQIQQASFLHEVVHGLMPSEADDEHLVSIIADNLYAFLVDNNLLKDGWWDKILDEEEGIWAIDVEHAVRELDGTKEEGVDG